MSADDDKAQLRGEARARRQDTFRNEGAGAAQGLARHLMAILENQPVVNVAAYWAVGSEIDLTPLLDALDEEGWNVALPVVVENNAPLIFRRWRSGDVLVEGPLKTLQPQADCEEIVPDVVLTPLLAFDDAGYRLGQGGGFYDRTLEKLKARAGGVLSIGVAFSAQRVDRVPRDGHDQRLDMIVTEKGRI
ncbi:MAG: 5-formyltetrahydrofolate cyclo-ligase [Rhodospirillales bacterium]|nr:5-formyltetrahydrofolate cyclo-ligase [Rhodospirillales bacterium]